MPNSGSLPRTSDAAPITVPLPTQAPSTSTLLAPIHTSSPITIPPRLGWNPCVRIGRAGSSNAWLVGASVLIADAVAGIQHAAGIDHAAAADHQIALATGRLDLHERIDDDVILDDDAAAANGILDIGKWGDPRGGRDAQHGYSAAAASAGAVCHASHSVR